MTAHLPGVPEAYGHGEHFGWFDVRETEDVEEDNTKIITEVRRVFPTNRTNPVPLWHNRADPDTGWWLVCCLSPYRRERMTAGGPVRNWRARELVRLYVECGCPHWSEYDWCTGNYSEQDLYRIQMERSGALDIEEHSYG
jgi:hypothetical protein